VLDFQNEAEAIRASFEPYYRTTTLGEETDPDKLHDLESDLAGSQVYSSKQVQSFANLYLAGADREQLDPILDACVGRYTGELDEDGQVEFKGKAKAFVRTYGFLASILPYNKAGWERLSIFLNFLVPKLPAPKEEDLSQGILETIDMDSYRVEARSALSIALSDEEAEIGAVPTEGGGYATEPELDRLSNIVRDFNDRFGGIEWKDRDKIERVIAEELPARVSQDKAYQNAIENSGRENARLEHDRALERAVTELLSDHTELFKQFSDNPSFQQWLSESSFSMTYGVPQR
jgi:type I restriction enzyme R subunit